VLIETSVFCPATPQNCTLALRCRTILSEKSAGKEREGVFLQLSSNKSEKSEMIVDLM